MAGFGIGSLIVLSVKFTDSTGADVDPTLVELWLREEIDGTELQWTMTGATGAAVLTPAGLSALVKDSVGDFHVNFTARKPERITAHWLGLGTTITPSQQTVFVRHSAVTAIDHP